MFFGGKVKEESTVRDSRGRHDRTDVRFGHPGPLEFGNRGTQQPLSRLQAFALACRDFVARCHCPFCFLVELDCKQYRERAYPASRAARVGHIIH
jgi:hypothetical protein